MKLVDISCLLCASLIAHTVGKYSKNYNKNNKFVSIYWFSTQTKCIQTVSTLVWWLNFSKPILALIE